jgi:segregation and condensation protein A
LADPIRTNGNGDGAYTTQLDGIRAPLGVILYLIRRDNLDIYDIPIAKITKEYLDYLNMMEGAHIELAGEFFVLAATLMRIKAQMLLRRDDDGDDDPREDLVRSLLEYKKMVEAARTFQDIEDDRLHVFTRPVREAEKQSREEPEIDLGLYQLMKAFQDVMYRFDAVAVREIELEEYTIEEKIQAVTAALRDKTQVLFTDFFEGVAGRMELIVTFMAMLEMIKHGHLRVRQEGAFSSIWLYQGPNFGAKLESVEDWFEVKEGTGEVLPKDSPHDVPDARLANAPAEETIDEGDTEAFAQTDTEPAGAAATDSEKEANDDDGQRESR